LQIIGVINPLLKIYSLLLQLTVLIVGSSFCQDKTNQSDISSKVDSSSSSIAVDFKMPERWIKINKNLFILNDYIKEYDYWESALKQGHMPWRYYPKNIVIACLRDFGISDSKSDSDFVERLIEIKKDKIYSLKVGLTNFIIYVHTKNHIPISYKFEIRKYKVK